MDAIQQQQDEFECVLSMFPDPHELTFDAVLKEQYEQYLSLPNTSDLELPPFAYTIRFVHLVIDGHVPELEIVYRRAYPLLAPVDFTVRCATLPRPLMETLQTELVCLATGAGDEPVVLQLYQCMADLLHDANAKQTQASREKETAIKRQSLANTTTAKPVPLLLGRRAIYFHHIIASTKRRVIKEWARELQLGGCSKIGWPGVVIVEGDERDVQEYVRRLQHLKWKQMTVRGEQTESVEDGESIDTQRKLPRAFCEFSETAMAEAAALCRDVGLEELFLSVMKIYRSEPHEEGEREGVKKKTGQGRKTSTKQ